MSIMNFLALNKLETTMISPSQTPLSFH